MSTAHWSGVRQAYLGRYSSINWGTTYSLPRRVWPTQTCGFVRTASVLASMRPRFQFFVYPGPVAQQWSHIGWRHQRTLSIFQWKPAICRRRGKARPGHHHCAVGSSVPQLTWRAYAQVRYFIEHNCFQPPATCWCGCPTSWRPKCSKWSSTCICNIHFLYQ